MRNKVAKKLRAQAYLSVDKDTAYETKKVKNTPMKVLRGASLVDIVWPSFRTTLTRGCTRAYYQWLKKEYKLGA